jgi:hypothetical protein
VVNASLNWASIVGIVLAVGGALLYFMRSFKPALARDYDVFFAAVGLLCGGILFFQGWRLDPILQFGQFLLAGTTVFFAYESVRLRGITTEQARRSSFFDDDEPVPGPRGRMGGGDWPPEADRFDEPQPLRRRIRSRESEPDDEEFYRPRRAARPAIPERAASRGPRDDDEWDRPSRRPGSDGAGYGTARTAPSSAGPAFGSRRRERDSGSEPRRGTRPVPSAETMPRSSRRPGAGSGAPGGPTTTANPASTPGVPQGTPLRGREPGGSGYAQGGRAPAASERPDAGGMTDAEYTPVSQAGGRPSAAGAPTDPSERLRPRDNSSRFDD